MKHNNIKTAVIAFAIFFSISIFSNDMYALGHPSVLGYVPQCAETTYCEHNLIWMVDTLLVTPAACSSCTIEVIFRYAQQYCEYTDEYWFGIDIWSIGVPNDCCSNGTISYTERSDYEKVGMNALYNGYLKPKITGLGIAFPTSKGLIRFTAVSCRQVNFMAAIHNFIPVALNMDFIDDPLPAEYIGQSGYICMLGCANSYICCGSTCHVYPGDTEYTWEHDYWDDCDQSAPSGSYCTAQCDKYQSMLNDVYSQSGNYDYGSWAKAGTAFTPAGEKILITPNPASDNITITMDETNTEGYEVHITDINGNLLLSSHYTNNRIDINTSEYSNGAYFVVIYQNDTPIFSDKIIIKK